MLEFRMPLVSTSDSRQDCRLLVLLLTLTLDYLDLASASSSWEHLSLRYGTWYRPPKTPREAQAMGYRRVNGICQMDTYHGFLYVHPHNDKSRLLFDLNDKLAGIQTAIPGNMMGFNSANETVRVPTKEVIPPILLSQEQYSPGIQMYTITAYFKHPSLICSPYTQHAHPGKGLYIQMGYRVERQYEKIPLDSRHLSSDWKTGTCLPSMGRHYFKNLTRDLACEKLYPVFLMYNDEGQLGGFGWLFQGIPPSESSRTPVKWFKYSWQFYPAIFDQSMLPSCMFNPAFNIFGIRVYLRNEHTMTCPRIQPAGHSDEKGGGYDNNNNNNNKDSESNIKHDNNWKNDNDEDEVTFRPLHPKKPQHNPQQHNTRHPNTSQSPKSPKYTNSQTNNVIDADVIRETGSNGAHHSGSRFSCDFTFVLFLCLMTHAMMSWCLCSPSFADVTPLLEERRRLR
ncbi:uncharacterized protein LOC101851793 [Aplysia californica]|uniref:Uncharacterized protein LOC101851793 n=1 Tax=Aplysia californica TaxID=6500 RepID=A0ABM0JGY7_APLCA|nr:uncharacterized protein LOC101851793 [Aplysia californica]